MKFTRLEIVNLRAVENVILEDLSHFVVIAGQNGCGKSCIFDAIRLLKSLYGGYAANEHMQWFGEFAINLHDQGTLARIFRDPNKSMFVSATLEFSDREVSYVRENVEKLAMPIAWQRVTSQPVDYYSFNRMSMATQYEHHKPQLDAQVESIREQTLNALRSNSQQLHVTLMSDGTLDLAPCLPAQLVFQAYDPEHLGVIEYQSASRAYTRQDVGGITLDTKAFEDQRRQQGLYNWQSKYQNVKTELASAYLRTLISKDADTADDDSPVGEDINQTLVELFETFFPDKTYEGPKALRNGNLQFPVKLSSGRTHDIDELS